MNTCDLDLSKRPPKVGVKNTELDGKARLPVRFVASPDLAPGPGVKSNLSWTLSLLSFCCNSFPPVWFWVRSQEEGLGFRSQACRRFHTLMCFKAAASRRERGTQNKASVCCCCCLEEVKQQLSPINSSFFTQCMLWIIYGYKGWSVTDNVP